MWATAIIFAISGFLLGHYREDGIQRICTALIGSYWFMRGVSYWGGGYPNEMALVEAIKSGQDIDEFLTNAFWCYLALFVFGWLGFWQYQRTYGSKEKTEDDSNFKN